MSDAWVRVVCEEPSHAGRRPEIESFMLTAEGYWIDLSVWDGDAKGAVRSSHTGTDLRDGVPIPPRVGYWILDADASPLPAGSTLRRRYNMTCPLCGLCVSVRAERLPKVLNPLQASGVSVISLRALARIVR